MPVTSEDIAQGLVAAFTSAPKTDSPYPHWLMDATFPDGVADVLNNLGLEAPDLDESGTREKNNATRVYFDTEMQEKHGVCKAIAEAFQSEDVIKVIADTFGADLDNTYLRIEYAQDVSGFWLVPHTDIGVKNLTLLSYLSDEPSHSDLGTDIYADAETWVGRSPFGPNKSMLFVPSDDTWHGFEERPFDGIRRSLIVNYVTDEWRAREQLAFPDKPIRLS